MAKCNQLTSLPFKGLTFWMKASEIKSQFLFNMPTNHNIWTTQTVPRDRWDCYHISTV